MAKQTEAFARALIDAQLSDQHWQISDGTSVRYDYTLPNGDHADYMLCSLEGRGLAIVEAKRESINAADAHEQDRRSTAELFGGEAPLSGALDKLSQSVYGAPPQ